MRAPALGRSVAANPFRIVLVVLAFVALACSGEKPAASVKAPAAAEQKLVVFAAASLREAFTRLGEELKKKHAGLELSFNFAGSQELRTQIEQGANADVFASADLKHMDALAQQKRVASSQLFARNEPVVVVPIGEASPIHAFAQLPTASRIVIGVPDVPIGRYTLQILDNASKSLGADFRSRVEAHVVSRELNVRQVLAKVSLGEADAGIVYRTDANSPDAKISVIDIPRELNVLASYPIASLSGAPHPELAQEFVTLVLGATGRARLDAAGFLPP